MSRLSLFIPSLAFLVMAALLVGCNGQPAEPLSPELLSGGQLPLNKLPADGNGNKEIWDLSWTETFNCGDGDIDVDGVGWGQYRVFGPPNNRNVDLGVFHLVWTFTNDAGETWTWRDVGPDHAYLQNDELFVTITGTSTASGNINRDVIVVGHVVLNLTTNETVFVAGRELGSVYDMACEALN